ncbi:MAG: NAD-dependent epimerase/dehydratase family protein [Longibaculum sp.]
MKKILVTGGTVFVSKFIADYFKKNNEVYVLNRNTRPQLDDVTLIEADRNELGDKLKKYSFDVVIDVCAYNKKDIDNLLNAINDHIKEYIFISSSAVYPETNKQPFCEEQQIGKNSIWGKYGTDKIEAEQLLLSRVPNAYILRPPYLYGPMQNVYREPFVFECALNNRKFYIPKDGKMKLQFFHVEDLCKMIEAILNQHPSNHVFNVGNEEIVDINTFVSLCYKVANKKLEIVNVYNHENQRDYFSFYDYEYVLDVNKQKSLLSGTKDLEEGLKESFEWYLNHSEDVVRKKYIDFIDNNF